MSTDPSIRERIEKLPLWVQNHIAELVRQREEAVKVLERFELSQKKHAFYFEEHACLTAGAPTNMTRYLDTHSVTFEHRGLRVDLTRMPQGLSLAYGGPMLATTPILCTPVSFQRFELRYPEK